MQHWRRLTSSVVPSVSTSTSTPDRDLPAKTWLGRVRAGRAALARIRWGHQEPVLLKDSSDDDHRMRSHDIHNDASAKVGEFVCADNWIFGRHKIGARLVFQ